MIETVCSRLMKLSMLNVGQYKNYLSKFERNIQGYIYICGFLTGFQRCSFYNFFATCHYFLWGYVKGLLYVPPLPVSVVVLRQRISTALQTVTQDMLWRVLVELEYRIDMCRVSGGEHIEHFLNQL